MSLCALDRGYKSRGWQAEDIKQPPQLIQQTTNQPTPLKMKFVSFFLLFAFDQFFKFHFFADFGSPGLRRLLHGRPHPRWRQGYPGCRAHRGQGPAGTVHP